MPRGDPFESGNRRPASAKTAPGAAKHGRTQLIGERPDQDYDWRQGSWRDMLELPSWSCFDRPIIALTLVQPASIEYPATRQQSIRIADGNSESFLYIVYVTAISWPRFDSRGSAHIAKSHSRSAVCIQTKPASLPGVERKTQIQRLQHLRRRRLANIAARENGAQIGIRLGVLQRSKRYPLDRPVGIEPSAYHHRRRRPVPVATVAFASTPPRVIVSGSVS